MTDIGTKIIGTVNKITENGCYCSLGKDGFGFMPKSFMDGYVNEGGNYLVSLRDRIEVVVYKIDKKGFIFLSSESSFDVMQEKERERQERIKLIKEKKEEKKKRHEEKKAKYEMQESFVEQFEPGVVFESEVVKVEKNKAVIRVGNIEGIIPKEEIDWNEINNVDNLLYEGEKVNADFMGYDSSP